VIRSPRGPEGGAHRDLPPARGGTGEQQVRHVRADDREDEADGAQEREERRPHGADHELVQRADPGPLARAHVRVALLQAMGERVHLHVGLRDRDPGLQAPEGVEPGWTPRSRNCFCPSKSPIGTQTEAVRGRSKPGGITPTTV
jgi:hypothetical protein